MHGAVRARQFSPVQARHDPGTNLFQFRWWRSVKNSRAQHAADLGDHNGAVRPPARAFVLPVSAELDGDGGPRRSGVGVGLEFQDRLVSVNRHDPSLSTSTLGAASRRRAR